MAGDRRLPAWAVQAVQANLAFLSAQQLSGSCATTSSPLSPKHRGLEPSEGCREIHTTIVCVAMPHLFLNNTFRVPPGILGDQTHAQTGVKGLKSCNLCEHLCYLFCSFFLVKINQVPWTETSDTLTGMAILSVPHSKLHVLEMHRNHSNFWLLLEFWLVVCHRNQALFQIVTILKTFHIS